MARGIGFEWYEKGWWIYVPAPFHRSTVVVCACEEATLRTILLARFLTVYGGDIRSQLSALADALVERHGPSILLSQDKMNEHAVSTALRSAFGDKLHPHARKLSALVYQERIEQARSSALGGPDVTRIHQRTFTLKMAPGTVRREPTGVTFMGFTKTVCTTHSYEQLRDTVYRAGDHAASIWGWRPTSLRVLVHEMTGKAVGYAFYPGGGDHRISLAKPLLQRYTLDSIYRVVLHELCHHYREERFPRTGFETNPHDVVFCNELAKVDDRLSYDNAKSCAYFLDEIMEDAKAVVDERRKLASARFELTTRKKGRKHEMALRMHPQKGRSKFLSNWYSTITDIANTSGWNTPVEVAEIWQSRLDLQPVSTLEEVVRRIFLPDTQKRMGLP